MDKQELENIAKARQTKDRIVFTNGCFDILHVGHTRYLAQARDLGDFLVVGLNSDSSIARLKGPTRPIVPEEERREMLLALKAVDAVVIFAEDTPKALIEIIRPDILVKGGDWAIQQIVGADFVQSYGGTVRSLAFHEGKSTTNIIEKVEKLSRK